MGFSSVRRSAAVPLLTLAFCCAGAEPPRLVSIDLGSEDMKAVAIHGSKFVTVLDEAGRRVLRNHLTFSSKGRIFGVNGVAQAIHMPRCGFGFMNHLLAGTQLDASSDRRPLSLLDSELGAHVYHYLENELEDGGTMLEKVYLFDHGKERLRLSGRELLAHMLLWIRGLSGVEWNPLTASSIPSPATPLSLVVEYGVGQMYRRSLIEAAQLSGFRVVSISTGVAAASVLRAIDLEVTSAMNIMYFDMGATKTNVCLSRYSPVEAASKTKSLPRIDILNCISPAHIGGHYIDLLIAKYLRDQWHKGSGHDMFQDEAASRKLVQAALSAKMTLLRQPSAAISVTSRKYGETFEHRLTLEDLSKVLDDSGLVSLLQSSIEELLRRCKMAKSDITVVEMLGSGWRLPMIKKSLESYFEPEVSLGYHINAEDGEVRGGAYLGASHLPSFRFPQVTMTENTNMTYYISIQPLGASVEDESKKEFTLFENGDRFHGSKTVTIRSRGDFRADLYEETLRFMTYEVRGLPAGAPEYVVELQVAVDANGLLGVTSARARVPPAAAPTAASTAESAAESAAESTAAAAAPPPAAAAAPPPAGAPPPTPAAEAWQTLKVTELHRDRARQAATLTKEAASILQMAKTDAEIAERDLARNNLEDVLYTAASDLEDNHAKYQKFCQASTLAQLQTALAESRQWYDDFSATARKEQLLAKYQEIKAQYGEIQNKANNIEEMPQLIKSLDKKFADWIESISQQKHLCGNPKEATNSEKEWQDEIDQFETLVGDEQALWDDLKQRQERQSLVEPLVITAQATTAISQKISKRKKKLDAAMAATTKEREARAAKAAKAAAKAKAAAAAAAAATQAAATQAAATHAAATHPAATQAAATHAAATQAAANHTGGQGSGARTETVTPANEAEKKGARATGPDMGAASSGTSGADQSAPTGTAGPRRPLTEPTPFESDAGIVDDFISKNLGSFEL